MRQFLLYPGLRTMFLVSVIAHIGVGFIAFPGEQESQQMVLPLRIVVAGSLKDQQEKQEPVEAPSVVKKVSQTVNAVSVQQAPVPVKKISPRVLPAKKAISEKPQRKAQSKKTVVVEKRLNGFENGINREMRARYEHQLLLHLERFKRYPSRALRLGLQGEGELYLKIRRSGELLSANVKKSSGFLMLDQEIQRMAKVAEPYPKIPENLKGSHFEFLIPVEFQLG